MKTLKECLEAVGSFYPSSYPVSVPNLPQVAYYPGSGNDRRLFDLLDGKGTIIYQDPFLKNKKLPPCMANVQVIPSRVTGEEGIGADLVYVAGMLRLLWLNSFTEHVIENTREGGYLIGKNADISYMGLLAANIKFIDENTSIIQGNYRETEFSHYLQDYPKTMEILLYALNVGTKPEELPDLSSKRFVEITQPNRSKHSSDIVRILRDVGRELISRPSGFYQFLGDYLPLFVQEASYLDYERNVDSISDQTALLR